MADLIKEIINFYNEKKQVEKFEETKKRFYGMMEEEFAKEEVTEKKYIVSAKELLCDCEECENFEGEENATLRITRVQNQKIIYDLEELKNISYKTEKKSVIKKTYTINDFDSFAEFAKKHGIKPQELKQYLKVEEEVDEKALNHLSDLGVVKDEEVKKCCTVKKGKPFFKIKRLDSRIGCRCDGGAL